MEVLYHIRQYFAGNFRYIALTVLIHGRYLQLRFLGRGHWQLVATFMGKMMRTLWDFGGFQVLFWVIIMHYMPKFACKRIGWIRIFCWFTPFLAAFFSHVSVGKTFLYPQRPIWRNGCPLSWRRRRHGELRSRRRQRLKRATSSGKLCGSTRCPWWAPRRMNFSCCFKRPKSWILMMPWKNYLTSLCRTMWTVNRGPKNFWRQLSCRWPILCRSTDSSWRHTKPWTQRRCCMVASFASCWVRPWCATLRPARRWRSVWPLCMAISPC